MMSACTRAMRARFTSSLILRTAALRGSSCGVIAGGGRERERVFVMGHVREAVHTPRAPRTRAYCSQPGVRTCKSRKRSLCSALKKRAISGFMQGPSQKLPM